MLIELSREIEKILSRLDKLEEDIHAQKRRLLLSLYQPHSDLEARINKLEKILSNLEDKVIPLQNKVNNLENWQRLQEKLKEPM